MQPKVMSFPVLIHLYDEENIDLVIMDPPWPNKSTTSSRSDEYAAIDIYDIFKIDLPSILLRSPSALVAVWVTNKPKVSVQIHLLWGRCRAKSTDSVQTICGREAFPRLGNYGCS